MEEENSTIGNIKQISFYYIYVHINTFLHLTIFPHLTILCLLIRDLRGFLSFLDRFSIFCGYTMARPFLMVHLSTIKSGIYPKEKSMSWRAIESLFGRAQQSSDSLVDEWQRSSDTQRLFTLAASSFPTRWIMLITFFDSQMNLKSICQHMG